MEDKFYYPELKCANCKKPNWLKVKKGQTVEEHVKDENILCIHCNCTPIKIKEEKEE